MSGRQRAQLLQELTPCHFFGCGIFSSSSSSAKSATVFSKVNQDSGAVPMMGTPLRTFRSSARFSPESARQIAR